MERNLRYLKGSILKGRISANDIIITLLFVVLALAPLFLSDFRTNLWESLLLMPFWL